MIFCLWSARAAPISPLPNPVFSSSSHILKHKGYFEFAASVTHSKVRKLLLPFLIQSSSLMFNKHDIKPSFFFICIVRFGVIWLILNYVCCLPVYMYGKCQCRTSFVIFRLSVIDFCSMINNIWRWSSLYFVFNIYYHA